MRRHLAAMGVTVALLGMAMGCGSDDGDTDATAEQTADGGGTTAPSDEATDAGADAEGSAGADIDADAIRDDPCSLVTQEEATSILGRPTSAPEAGDAVGAVESTCAYSVETDRPSEVQVATVSMMFTPDRVDGNSDGAAYMVAAREGVEVEELTGLGDEAFCVVPGIVFARVGDVVLSTGSDTCDSARQFATRAVSRL